MIFLRNSQTFLEANTYILADDAAKVALVVDPGAGSHAWIPGALASRGLTLGAVLLTHGHPDHVWDVAVVAGTAPVYLPGPDMYRMDDPLSHLPLDASTNLALSRMGAQPWEKPAGLRELPAEAFSAPFEIVPGIVLRALPTPGHSEGSTVFLFEGDPTPDREGAMMSTGRVELIMIAGDVLFNGGIGRTDFPGGDEQKMASSLRLLVQVIKPETYVFPGHGPSTTLFHEVRHNPFLQSAMS
ncbi:MBL fold metallo-hydrolase [Trueperella pecoris]|uniref:MBL fold metallo-hydrolase n=1 Tax=Trueperella pecoris TaxID=2733571 RepID=UPI001ABE263D|nr:MBL fold metallo-hydrolase [Trueperella pecoris]QTG76322.1 MBL fold metallo-hydrolase [Trueperella pecoris]